MNTSRMSAAALLAAAFLLGLLSGAGAVAFAERHGASPFHDGRRGGQSYLDRLTETLDLTPAQRDSVRQVLDRRTPAMDSLWQEVGPRFETLRSTIRSEIRTLLTPEQRRQYEEMLQRHDAQRHARPGSSARP
jgi:Spy/CpxP family protein refolding chaperone